MALGDATDPRVSDPKRIAKKLHVSWARASAHQLSRVLVDGEGGKND